MSKERIEIASIHEAGHALVSEILEPQSVNLVTISNYFGDKGGITAINQNENYWLDIKYRENRIMVLLAGRAATEIILNRLDCGARNDIDRARSILEDIHNGLNANNFNYYDYDSSHKAKEIEEAWVKQELNNYYNKTKEIVFNNKNKLEKIYKLLMDKKVLLQKDIKKIMG